MTAGSSRPIVARRRRLAHLAEATLSRGERFAARRAHRPLARFDDLYTIPAWQLLDAASCDRLGVAAAVLHYRAQLDRALDGHALRPLAVLCGENLFDRLRAADVQPDISRADDTAALPPGADAWRDAGQALLSRGESCAATGALIRAATQLAEPLAA